MRRVCIIGISGKLGQYMAEHSLAHGYEVVGFCRPESVGKLARFGHRIIVFPGWTNDRSVVERAVKGCDGVLTDDSLIRETPAIVGCKSGSARAHADAGDPGRAKAVRNVLFLIRPISAPRRTPGDCIPTRR